MKKAYIFAGISIFLWSTVAVMAKLLLNSLNNFQVLWVSAFFSGVALIVYTIYSGTIREIKAYTFKDYIISALIAFPGTCLYYVFFYAGSDLMPASQAFIVNYLWPIMSVVFACIILKEKMTLKKAIAIFMSFFGVVIVTGSSISSFDKSVMLGTAFCVLGAVSYGIFTAVNKKMSYSKPITMMIGFFEAFIITTVINFINRDLFLPDLMQTLGFMWNGIMTMAVASTLWLVALTMGNTAKISNLAYITPFLSLVWTALILHEPIKLSSVIGLAVIVLGIFIQIKDKK